MKKCKICLEEFDESNFYKSKQWHLSSYCKKCNWTKVNDYRKRNWIKSAHSVRKWRLSKSLEELKARELHSSMVKRSKDRWLTYPELSVNDILLKIQKWVCEKTWVNLIISKDINPYTPSIDRIDINLPYTRSNTRMVSYMYNCMKNQFTDDDVKEFITNGNF